MYFMIKKFVYLFILFVILLFTGCSSLIENVLFTSLGPPNGHGFSYGKVNPVYGYERFPWGTSYEVIDKQTGWNLSYITKTGRDVCCIGSKNSSPLQPKYSYIPHGTKDKYVDETLLYFDNNRLYAAQDGYKKKQTLKELHARYGDFSEENLITIKDANNGIDAIYKGKSYLDVNNFYAIEIFVYRNGKTYVKIRDPFFERNVMENNSNNKWGCYVFWDTSAKRINFTFLNKNEDNQYLFVGYSKGYENPSISYVRSGVFLDKKSSGLYEIKGDTGVVSKNFTIEEWYSAFDKNTYNFTFNQTDGAREVLELFVNSQDILVRHNKEIFKFVCKNSNLLDKMAEYGITWAEIDAALANEEF